MRCLSLCALLALAAGCDSSGPVPAYMGPSDYAYTLTVSCFCIVRGPIRVTVADGAVADAVALNDPDASQDAVDATARTLEELTEIAARAEREADEVSVTYDPTYGFPTELSIDWTREAADDEVSYEADDFEAR